MNFAFIFKIKKDRKCIIFKDKGAGAGGADFYHLLEYRGIYSGNAFFKKIKRLALEAPNLFTLPVLRTVLECTIENAFF
jgi:hypothetical protein